MKPRFPSSRPPDEPLRKGWETILKKEDHPPRFPSAKAFVFTESRLAASPK